MIERIMCEFFVAENQSMKTSKRLSSYLQPCSYTNSVRVYYN